MLSGWAALRIASFEWSWHRGRAQVHVALRRLRSPGPHGLAGLAGASSGRGGHSKGAPAAPRPVPASCGGAGMPAGVVGVVQIPAIGLVAPLAIGTSEAVLAADVGLEPASARPGKDGTSVLAAHDVSYFVHLDSLRPGALIEVREPCASYTYRVTSGQVVSAGAPVANTSAPSIALVTCWPTDALWYTSQRYLVLGSLVSRSSSRAMPAAPAGTQRWSVPAPPALVAQGLTLQQNWWPMGRLATVGSPAASWSQSPAPLGAETSALEVLFGLRHAVASGEHRWWRALAPGVAWQPWLAGAPTGPLEVTETVVGSRLSSVTLASSVTGAGTFSLTLGASSGVMTAQVLRKG